MDYRVRSPRSRASCAAKLDLAMPGGTAHQDYLEVGEGSSTDRLRQAPVRRCVTESFLLRLTPIVKSTGAVGWPYITCILRRPCCAQEGAGRSGRSRVPL